MEKEARKDHLSYRGVWTAAPRVHGGLWACAHELQIRYRRLCMCVCVCRRACGAGRRHPGGGGRARAAGVTRACLCMCMCVYDTHAHGRMPTWAVSCLYPNPPIPSFPFVTLPDLSPVRSARAAWTAPGCCTASPAHGMASSQRC
jgi:hypothetical protein